MAVSDIILKNCSLFRQVSAEVLHLAASQMDILQLKKREVLLVNGNAFRGLGVVLQGRLQAMDYTIDGREVALTTADSDQAFGQANLIAPRPVDLNWVAVSQCTVAIMQPKHALDLLNHADMAKRVATDLAQQVCEFLSWQKILAVHPVSARVCAWILWESSGKTTLQVPKHAELAWRLSTTRESITRTLQKLQTEAVVQREGDTWLIANPQTLAQMALGDSKSNE